jgi:hypothetical protein
MTLNLRLAYNLGPVNAYGALSQPAACGGGGGIDHADETLSKMKPDIRLAVAPMAVNGGANSVQHHVTVGGLGHPSLRLALLGGGPAHPNGATGRTLTPQATTTTETSPALLVSYVYLDPFLKNQHRYAYRDWVLDSGAFSAHMSGTKIDLTAYIAKCKELLASDPTLTEVFALDVIGDYRASLRNCEKMWEAGVPAIPCYHINEPVDALFHIAKTYPKVALGGVARVKRGIKLEFARQCFARVWPKKIHGFGFGDETSILSLPFHSTDATNWELGPCAFGRWNSYGKLSVRGSKQNLRAEVEWYLRLEERARRKWVKEMALLEAGGGQPTIRLAAQQSSDAQIRRSGFVVSGHEKERLKAGEQI